MSDKKRKGEWVVEDKARGLLDVCKHSAPACWPCVALDMERQRDEARAEVERLIAGAERDAKVIFAAYDKREQAEALVRVAQSQRDTAETLAARMERERDEARASLARVTEERALERARWESREEDLTKRRLMAEAECARLREEGAEGRAAIVKLSDANVLAAEVQKLIDRKLIDCRSPAADALLDFVNPGPTESVPEKIAASLRAPSPKEDAPRCEACDGKGWSWLHPVPAGGGNLKAGDCPDCGGTGRSPSTTGGDK